MIRLKKFPYRRLTARTGTIRGFLFENRHAGVPRTLFHEIRVPLEPFDIVGSNGKRQVVKTAFEFEFIQLPDRPFGGYRALVGRTFDFGPNPEDGYIDASIYLGNAHNVIDVAALSFVSLRSGLLEVGITLAFDFEAEQTGYSNSDALAIDVLLRPKPILIDGEIVKKSKHRNPRALLAPFVDPALLGDVVREADRVAVKLRSRRTVVKKPDAG